MTRSSPTCPASSDLNPDPPCLRLQLRVLSNTIDRGESFGITRSWRRRTLYWSSHPRWKRRNRALQSLLICQQLAQLPRTFPNHPISHARRLHQRQLSSLHLWASTTPSGNQDGNRLALVWSSVLMASSAASSNGTQGGETGQSDG